MMEYSVETYRRACDRLIFAMLESEELARKWWSGYNKNWQKTPEEAFKDSPRDVYEYLLTASYGGW